MKILITLASCLMFAHGLAMAQAPENKPAKTLIRLQEQLDLSEAQVAEIQDIESRGGSKEEVRSVLTEEQLSALKARHKKNKEKKAAKAERLALMQAELDLSEEQVAQIRTILDQGGKGSEVSGVLNEEQKIQLEAYRKKYRAQKDDYIPGLQQALELNSKEVDEIRVILSRGGSRAEIVAVLTKPEQ